MKTKEIYLKPDSVESATRYVTPVCASVNCEIADVNEEDVEW